LAYKNNFSSKKIFLKTHTLTHSRGAIHCTQECILFLVVNCFTTPSRPIWSHVQINKSALIGSLEKHLFYYVQDEDRNQNRDWFVCTIWGFVKKLTGSGAERPFSLNFFSVGPNLVWVIAGYHPPATGSKFPGGLRSVTGCSP
jgi:hypothetical protein